MNNKAKPTDQASRPTNAKSLRSFPFLLLGLFLFTFTACEDKSDTKSAEEEAEVKVPSVGPSGQIYVFVDTTAYQGKVGQAIKEVLNKPMPGLINSEPSFTINTIDATFANRLTHRYHSIVYLLSLEHQTPQSLAMIERFDDQTIKRVKQDTSLLFFQKKNQFSYPQLCNYIIARDDATLANYLLRNKKTFFDLLWNFERKYTAHNLYDNGLNRQATKQIQKHLQVKLKVPKKYLTAKESEDFIWFRDRAADMDKNVFVYRTPYLDTSQFNHDTITAMVERVTSSHIFGSGEDGDTSTAMILEKREPLYIKTKRFKGFYAKEIRGIWKLADNYMGGVFLAYLLLDEATQTLYLVEGFPYAPNQGKREKLRELEAILHTFQPLKTKPVKKEG